MAAIGITVTDGHFNISMDKFEWKSLEVDGQTMSPESPIKPDNLKFKYTQEGEGSIRFVAKSNNNITIVNPGNVMILEAAPGVDKTYVAVIDYVTEKDEVIVYGWLMLLHGRLENAGPGPFPFNQGRMTGVFSRS